MTVTTGKRDETQGFHLSLSPISVPTLSGTARCEVTLLFSDLRGYSAFTEESDVAEVAAVMGLIKDEATRIVREHGGMINQFVGDEVVAIFGFPTHTDDDTRRAVNAAIEMHALVRSSRINRILTVERQLTLHSGIDAGVVLIDSRDVRNGLFTLTGSVMNRAARLRALARPDEILVSDRAHVTLNRFFVTEQLAPCRFKGITDTIIPSRILARRESVSLATTTAHVRASRELAMLCERWNQAIQDGGSVVEILGAAGSGKSRLLGRFVERFHQDPARVFLIECRDHDNAPFSALKRMFDDHLLRTMQLTTAMRTQRQSALRAAAGPLASHIALLSPNLAELLSDVAATVELPDVQQVFVDSLVEFIARYLEAVGPSAIAIDDAHWLDHGSRIVVSLLVARIRAGGHLLVYAARDEPVHRRTVELLRTALPPDNLTSLRLGPMSQGELSGLVAEYLSSVAAPDPEMVRQLATLTDGTPLSALELLRLALEQGYLNQHDGVWRLESAIHKMQLPGSSRELIARRVARLATSRRRFRPMAQPDSSSRMFSLVSTQPVVWNRIPATPTTPFGVRRSVPSKPATMYWRWRFCDRPSRPRGTRTFCQTETSTSSLPRLVYGRASTMQASPISKLHSHAPAPGMNAHTCSAALPGYTIATPMPTDAGLRYPLDCQSLAALRLSAVTESY